MSCTLYLLYKGDSIKVGRFKDKATAVAQYRYRRKELEQKHGAGAIPVYVEHGKRK